MKTPLLEPGHIRLIGPASIMRTLSEEQQEELNHLLRGTRKDRRRGERMLRKLGIGVVYADDLRDGRPIH